MSWWCNVNWWRMVVSYVLIQTGIWAVIRQKMTILTLESVDELYRMDFTLKSSWSIPLHEVSIFKLRSQIWEQIPRLLIFRHPLLDHRDTKKMTVEFYCKNIANAWCWRERFWQSYFMVGWKDIWLFPIWRRRSYASLELQSIFSILVMKRKSLDQWNFMSCKSNHYNVTPMWDEKGKTWQGEERGIEEEGEMGERHVWCDHCPLVCHWISSGVQLSKGLQWMLYNGCFLSF